MLIISIETTQVVDYENDIIMENKIEKKQLSNEENIQLLKNELQKQLNIEKEKLKELKEWELKSKAEEREYQKLVNEINRIRLLRSKPSVPCFKIRHPKGVVGLQNLGNTCYMNSALQCLVKAPGIRDYFLTDQYKKEINKVNRLGTGGELAEAFGDFLKTVYKYEYADLSPRFIKLIIGKYCSQFSDFSQQDSAELIQYILDGLHEDLNRVIEKPQTSPVEANDRPDAIVSEESWKVHKMRNNSIFVDKFQGQYRSKLYCPNCNNSTSTFDPFFNLTVPVPIPTRFKKIKYLFVPISSERKMELYCVIIKAGSSISELRSEIVKQLGLSHNRIFIAGLNYDREIAYIYDDSRKESEIFDDEAVSVFEIPEIQNSNDSSQQNINYAEIIFEISKKLKFTFLIPFKKESSNKDIYKYCFEFLKRYLLENLENLENIEFDQLFSLYILNTETRNYSIIPLNSSHTFITEKFVKIYLDLKNPTPWNIQAMSLPFENYPKSDTFNIEFPVEKPKTLYECLDLFSKQEDLSEEGNWTCPNCNKKGNRSKKTDIWTLPETLIIQLNRFQSQDFTRTKLTHPIDFPIYNLDMSKYTENKNNIYQYYDLFAVSNHYGTLSSGHYTSYGKIIDNVSGLEKWYKYDDMTVTEIDSYDIEREIVSPAGYVLFYQAKSQFKLPPKISLPTIRIQLIGMNKIELRMIYNPETTIDQLKEFISNEMRLQKDEFLILSNKMNLTDKGSATFSQLGIIREMSLIALKRTKINL